MNLDTSSLLAGLILGGLAGAATTTWIFVMYLAKLRRILESSTIPSRHHRVPITLTFLGMAMAWLLLFWVLFS